MVVTKDRDFRDSHLLHNFPRRLLVVATGNIANDDLLALFEANLGFDSRGLRNVRKVGRTVRYANPVVVRAEALNLV